MNQIHFSLVNFPLFSTVDWFFWLFAQLYYFHSFRFLTPFSVQSCFISDCSCFRVFVSLLWALIFPLSLYLSFISLSFISHLIALLIFISDGVYLAFDCCVFFLGIHFPHVLWNCRLSLNGKCLLFSFIVLALFSPLFSFLLSSFAVTSTWTYRVSSPAAIFCYLIRVTQAHMEILWLSEVQPVNQVGEEWGFPWTARRQCLIPTAASCRVFQSPFVRREKPITVTDFFPSWSCMLWFLCPHRNEICEHLCMDLNPGTL